MDIKDAAATALPTDSKAGAVTPAPSYDDFEPFCSWKREEGQEILVVHVPGIVSYRPLFYLKEKGKYKFMQNHYCNH